MSEETNIQSNENCDTGNTENVTVQSETIGSEATSVERSVANEPAATVPQFKSMLYDAGDETLDNYRALADKYISFENQKAFFDEAKALNLSPEAANYAAKKLIDRASKEGKEIEQDEKYSERTAVNKKIAQILFKNGEYEDILRDLNSTVRGSKFLDAYTQAYFTLLDENQEAQAETIPAGASAAPVEKINGKNWEQFPRTEALDYLAKVESGLVTDPGLSKLRASEIIHKLTFKKKNF